MTFKIHDETSCPEIGVEESFLLTGVAETVRLEGDGDDNFADDDDDDDEFDDDDDEFDDDFDEEFDDDEFDDDDDDNGDDDNGDGDGDGDVLDKNQCLLTKICG